MSGKAVVLVMSCAMLAGYALSSARADEVEFPRANTLNEDELVGVDAQGDSQDGETGATSSADTSNTLEHLSKHPIAHPTLSTPDDIGMALRPQLPAIGANR